MEEIGKRAPAYEYDVTGADFTFKREKTPSKLEITEKNENEFEERENMMAWLSMEDDESTKELWKLLESEITSHPYPVKVKFIQDPYSLPLIFGSSSSYVTINGNEESCGSSFSESDSSFMVGISNVFQNVVVNGGAWDVDDDEACGWMVEEEGLVKAASGSDCSGDYDDDMLAKFLGEDFFQSQ